jgi:predicted Fe-Mo cluster-binding NifX family protein
MKFAVAVWNNRVAPVFDVAREIHIVHSESGRILGETVESIGSDLPTHKALRLRELGVTSLVCGAISHQLLGVICVNGIQVFPFITGDLREVIRAFLAGSLKRGHYAMPGCRRRRRHSGRLKGPDDARNPTGTGPT